MMELGKKIRQLRLKSGMTQEQLANKIGVGAQSVSKWENAAAMPDITLLPQLAVIFGAAAVTVKKAFTAENSKFGKTTVTGHADISGCVIDGALTLKEKTGETKLTNVTVKGKAAVANPATLDSCKMGALSAKGVLTVNGGEYESITVSAKAGATTLNGEIKIAKNLTVSNDLVIDGNSEVGGKFTAKAALSINGFTVKNGK